MRNLLTTFVLMFLTFAGTSVALAQTDAELIELAKPVLEAIMGGSYMYAAALGLVLFVALVRRFGGSRFPWLASKSAAPFIVLAGSFAAAMATSLSAGAAISGAMAWMAVKVAVAAAGGYSLFKPLLSKLQGMAPGWMSPLFALSDWVFRSRSNAERARAAGDAAVAENPGKGSEIKFDEFP